MGLQISGAFLKTKPERAGGRAVFLNVRSD
jgi:hypothetical protein